ncbi:TPA: hypothetical protein L7V51_005022 [Klebsiella pneumoniae]|nr:hypothetical protein [Klebsiella pneumoniae]MBZ7264749.1 hypothetical protein [Klebsiella oxytoca]NHA25706.1 hypothetical protein [Enterobacter roggenkampii]ELZ9605471.1 hypothetical protein [Klebsiella pneumoniae]MBG2362529.1 hypothetical protein [Klebsiella pneumoniae]
MLFAHSGPADLLALSTGRPPEVAVKLSVHLGSGRNFHYAEDDRDILTNIRFRPDRASREENRTKYTPEQSQIFMCR